MLNNVEEIYKLKRSHLRCQKDNQASFFRCLLFSCLIFCGLARGPQGARGPRFIEPPEPPVATPLISAVLFQFRSVTRRASVKQKCRQKEKDSIISHAPSLKRIAIQRQLRALHIRNRTHDTAIPAPGAVASKTESSQRSLKPVSTKSRKKLSHAVTLGYCEKL